MKQILRIRAIFIIAINRLLAQRLLSLSTIAGLTVAIALILTIPIYSESVAFRILSQRLIENDDQSNRPPFSYMISYIGSWAEPIDIEDTDALDTFLRERGGTELGLETSAVISHFETMNFRLYPSSETTYDDENASLEYVTFGITDDIFNQVTMVEGTPPTPADPSSDSVVDVMVHENFATEFGMQVGDTYLGYNWRLAPSDVMQVTTVRIAGIWRPTDEDSAYWFYRPSAFEDILIVHEDTFKNRLAPYTEEEVNLAVWYLVTDGSGVNTGRVDELITRHDETEKKADQLLPGAYIQVSPVKELKPYQRIVTVLTLTLTVFSIPVVALLVLFLIMIIGLTVDKQRNETAVLRSRGTSPLQVIGLAGVEAILMGIVAMIIGLLLAMGFTQLMGATRSFMDFEFDSRFFVSIPPTMMTTMILSLLFTIIIRIVPTLSASRHTIISYKLDNARLANRPIWQRLGIDLILLIVIGYFYYQVVQQGGLVDIESISEIEQAYDQPFVFLLPPLTIFAMTLFTLRLLPLILRFLTWIIQLTNSVGMLIVTRQLERSPQTYYLPLILLVSTVSLGVYTASFARTIDRYLYEQQYYRVGADLAIRVLSSSETLAGGNADDSGAAMVSMHISEFSTIDSIQDASRIGEYGATARLTSGNVDGTFIGIDRAEIGPVVFWRQDFSPVRLGYLTNNLGIRPDTVLVSREFMQNRNLEIGDLLQLEIRTAGAAISLNLQIVGGLDYFPRWYPEDDGVLFVGNLDYVFEQAQTELPHRILARIDDTFNEREFTREIIRRGAVGVLIDEPISRIEREQGRPERQGLFGFLSIGFITSSLATMGGFLLYTLFSYQRRYVELGILRAIGLSQGSMMLAVAWELCLLIIMGLTLGLGIGLFVSMLYIPYMQFVSNISGIVPPYVVMIAWYEIAQIVGLFVGTFVIIMLFLMVILRRMRIFQAVKLGETL